MPDPPVPAHRTNQRSAVMLGAPSAVMLGPRSPALSAASCGLLPVVIAYLGATVGLGP